MTEGSLHTVIVLIQCKILSAPLAFPSEGKVSAELTDEVKFKQKSADTESALFFHSNPCAKRTHSAISYWLSAIHYFGSAVCGG